MRHAEDDGEPMKARNFYRVAIHARQLETAAAVVARTPYTRYWSLILCIYYVFVEFRTKHGFITFYCWRSVRFGFDSTRAHTRTHTQWSCRRFGFRFFLFSSCVGFVSFGLFYRRSLGVRFDNNSNLIVIHMQLAATMKQIINKKSSEGPAQ